MPDAISKPMSFPERTPAATVRKRRWWIAAIVAVTLVVVLAAFTAWYLRVCGNCGPIICDNPCSLPTFSQLRELPGTDA
jgi:predicted cobalt transporter CbtA